ncbi:hypothetical protein LIER_14055 [Lithospermum erythrorhizon]|uniref:Uncharacterized protein n=1 Tax=Lithospermum erythrorhizon TaxID=34254 RepID=A0AAV3Q0V8_LITER
MFLEPLQDTAPPYSQFETAIGVPVYTQLFISTMYQECILSSSQILQDVVHYNPAGFSWISLVLLVAIGTYNTSGRVHYMVYMMDSTAKA